MKLLFVMKIFWDMNLCDVFLVYVYSYRLIDIFVGILFIFIVNVFKILFKYFLFYKIFFYIKFMCVSVI